MALRTGQEFLASIRDDRCVFMDGERIRDVTADPRLAGAAGTLARLYDLQHDPAHTDILTYQPTAGAERASLSFIEPRSREDLVRRGAAMKFVADQCCGLFGRTPDFMNVGITALASASEVFTDAAGRDFGANVRRYYEFVRDGDLTMTHIQVNPQVDRTKQVYQQSSDIALRVVKETDAGFYVHGMRLVGTLAQFANEIVVMPSVVVTNDASAADYAFAFAVDAATEGVSIISRPTVIPQNQGHPNDHPLSSRFDEGDATIVFDNVFVPWERAFVYRDVDRCNRLYKLTFLADHYTHQTQTRALAKSEFMAGLACYLAKSTKVDAFPNVQATLADLLMFVELQRALVAQALATAVPTPFGTYAPNRWPLHTAQLHFYERYDRMINAVRTLGAGGLVAAPSYAELGGEIGDVVERYFASATLDSEKRIRLLRLAADASISSFSGRQSLYERYYQGDPVRRVSAYYADYAAAPLVDRIETLLADFAEHPPVIPGHVTQRSPK